MDFDPTEEQRLLINTVERFTKDFYSAGQRSVFSSLETGFSPDAWAVMAETGLLALPFSEHAGGLGGHPADLTYVAKALGKSLCVEPFVLGTILAGTIMERIGTTAQKTAWLDKIIGGTGQLALAHSEEKARYNLSFVETRYKEKEDSTLLSGEKYFVMAAGGANAFIVSAIPEEFTQTTTDHADIMRFFLVHGDADGLERKSYRLTDGSVANKLVLNNVMGEPMENGFSEFSAAITKTKIVACAEMIGIMEHLFDATLDYLKTREQFGKPLSKFQVIQHRMADLYTSLELSQSHLHRMVAGNPSEAGYGQEIAGAKAYISDAAVNLAQEAVQLHGGIGVTDELAIGHGLKRILVLSKLFGDADTELKRSLQ